MEPRLRSDGTPYPDRSHYVVRKLHFGDPETDDLSATTTAAERLEMMGVLTLMCWEMMGRPGDVARVQRHIGGAYQREG